MAWVVVQHLDPTHKGMLPELLQRATSMKVVQVRDRMRVKPDCVYVIPPNRDMSLLHGALHLFEPTAPRGLRLPIDFLFRSLAADQNERSVGVVLSGMGADGTLGLARHQGGRRARPRPGAVLGEVRRHAAQRDRGRISPTSWRPSRSCRSGSSPTSGTRPSTRGRRPSCRTAIGAPWRRSPSSCAPGPGTTSRSTRAAPSCAGSSGGWESTRSTGSRLTSSTSRRTRRRCELLFRELLIGVTSFFRDPAAWDQLRDEVLPPLLAEPPPEKRPARLERRLLDRGGGLLPRHRLPGGGREGRAPGGPEAPGLRHRSRHRRDRPRPPGALPAGIATDVSADRLKRFFVQEEGGSTGSERRSARW